MNDELAEKFMHTMWLARFQRMQFHAEHGHLADTTRGQGRILAVLKLQDGMKTKDLAHILGLHIASLNELISKLIKGGYVTREQSPEDGRVMIIKLTDKGRNEEQAEQPGLADIFDALTAEEQETLGGYLDRVNSALQERLGLDDEDIEKFSAEAGGRRKRPGGRRRGAGRGPGPRDFRGGRDPRGGGFGRFNRGRRKAEGHCEH
ncbi:MAG: MarR family transcriptional regulator [Thermomicrobiales bacterium]|nr:MarR family transcriptional regulator [Thermomicrobiales bacterium]